MTVKILFLAANPQSTTRLSLDEEIRSITEKIRLSDAHDMIELVSAWAVRPDDLLQNLNQHRPHIVHFSGHGSPSGSIILVDSAGRRKPVSAYALKALFTSLKDNIQVVVLNACYSKIQGEAIASVIDYVIGMKAPISDKAAALFAASFYSALGFNRSVQEAFDQARTALLLEGIAEEDTPELIIRNGADASRKLIREKGWTGREEDEPLTAQSVAQSLTPARLFLSYKSHQQPDENLALFLNEYLANHGQKVFIDKTIRAGDEWLETIDREIKASDYLVVLLSEASANSQMVQGEIMRAYDYGKLQGRPRILPVRVAYSDMVPYSLTFLLSSVQYVVWNDSTDNERVGNEILAALKGTLPDKPPFQVQSDVVSSPTVISEDGKRVSADDPPLQPPLPEFDPRFLEELEEPGGAVKLRNSLYIERDADRRLNREVCKAGTTISIIAPHQTGKSSLLLRGLNKARQQSLEVVLLDLQRVDRDNMQDCGHFLRYLADFIALKLKVDPAVVDRYWVGPFGPQDKLTSLFEDCILPEREKPIILAIDEADRLLQMTLHTDFFALLRFWSNSRAGNELWDRLNIILAIFSEPHLLIKDTNQSPFNVDLRLSLKDFDSIQVQELNRRHGSPVSDKDFPELMNLLGGHPYLTRKALYNLVTEPITWKDLAKAASTAQGPFGDHLRDYLWLLHDELSLRAAFKQIIRGETCADVTSVLRLLRAGLISPVGDSYRCRCGLYQLYFKDKL